MKRVNYIINLPTNIPEEGDLAVNARVARDVCEKIQDYKRPEVKMDTTANGNVTISFDTTEIEINDFGDISFFFYLICNDDVEKTGISDEIYRWMEKELRAFVDYIMKLKIEVGQGLHPNPDGDKLTIITSDDLDLDYLDGGIDSIEEYVD